METRRQPDVGNCRHGLAVRRLTAGARLASTSITATAWAAFCHWCCPVSPGRGRTRSGLTCVGPALPIDGPVPARQMQGTAERPCGRMGDRDGINVLRVGNHRHTGPEDTRLLPRDTGRVGAEKRLMIQGNRGRDADADIRHGIGAVQPPPMPHPAAARQPGLRKAEEGRCGHGLEDGGAGRRHSRRRPVSAPAHRPHRQSRRQAAAPAPWGGTDRARYSALNPQALPRQHGVQAGNDRTLAVGAGDMDNRRQAPVRCAQPFQKCRQTLQIEFHPTRAQAGDPVQCGVGQGRSHDDFSGTSPASSSALSGSVFISSESASGSGITTGSGGGRDAGGATTGSRISERMRPSVSASSWRCTTMSTMPCSSRYSAR